MKNYLRKIAYHLACGNKDKAQYFFNRQVELYGPITDGDMRVILKLRSDIVREWEMEMKEFNAHIG